MADAHSSPQLSKHAPWLQWLLVLLHACIQALREQAAEVVLRALEEEDGEAYSSGAALPCASASAPCLHERGDSAALSLILSEAEGQMRHPLAHLLRLPHLGVEWGRARSVLRRLCRGRGGEDCKAGGQDRCGGVLAAPGPEGGSAGGWGMGGEGKQ